ncbi:hypothetical protein JL720_12075 [Aureococcus anophagefferens]|nr:hypothetical protein JL720_12075 [Aureococcus anophagefferens]
MRVLVESLIATYLKRRSSSGSTAGSTDAAAAPAVADDADGPDLAALLKFFVGDVFALPTFLRAAEASSVDTDAKATSTSTAETKTKRSDPKPVVDSSEVCSDVLDAVRRIVEAKMRYSALSKGDAIQAKILAKNGEDYCAGVVNSMSGSRSGTVNEEALVHRLELMCYKKILSGDLGEVYSICLAGDGGTGTAPGSKPVGGQAWAIHVGVSTDVRELFPKKTCGYAQKQLADEEKDARWRMMSKVERPYKTAGKAYNASKPEQTEKYLADKSDLTCVRGRRDGRCAPPPTNAKYAAAADAGAAALAPLQEQASIWGTPEKRTGAVSAARLDEALGAAREHAEWDSPGVGSVPSPYPSPAPARVFDMDAAHREYKGKLN